MKKLLKLLKLLQHPRAVRGALATQLAVIEEGEDFACGGLTDAEEREVVRLVEAASQYPGPIIEFGTLFGLTSKLMASVADTSQRIVTIDNFCWNPFGITPTAHETFTRKVLRVELEAQRVELVVTGSKEFRESYTDEIPSMVFLDADHSYGAVKAEIAWAKSIGVPLICGHDYQHPRFGVTQAVDEEFPEGVEFAGMVWWKQA